MKIYNSMSDKMEEREFTQEEYDILIETLGNNAYRLSIIQKISDNVISFEVLAKIDELLTVKS